MARGKRLGITRGRPACGGRFDTTNRPPIEYTIRDLALCFGELPSTIMAWIKAGRFGKARMRGDAARVPEQDVMRFLLAAPPQFDLARVNQEWFKRLIFRHRGRRNELA
ncbi:MAG: hypothetical protein ABSH05_17730 [Bryobacteraceae bacterium]|jgi:hypothetical protein